MVDTNAVDLSLVIPCYNEIQVIRDSVPRVQEILDSTKYSYEIILFDDGSKDGTRLIGAELANNNKKIRWYTHDKNYGRGKTVSDGIKLARGKIVGFIDMDLEVPAEYIVPLALEIDKGADVAIAVRLEHTNFEKIPFYKRPIAILYWFIRFILSAGYSYLVTLILGVKLKDTEVGFKFFNREKILLILDKIEDNHWFWDTEIMVRSYYKGFNIKEYPVLYLKKNEKRSTVKVFSDSVYYIKRLFCFQKKVLPKLISQR